MALQKARSQSAVLLTFAIMFAAAGLCRLVSAGLLARHSEPTPVPANMQRLPLSQLSRLGSCSGGQLLLYLAAVQAAVQMASPFFTPFMLRKLELSYGSYVTLISAAYLSKIVALPMWGRVASHMGARRLMWIGALGITPLSALWIVSQSFNWLLALQLVGGATWAAYELAFFLLFFESIAQEQRTSMLTVYNLFNTAAWAGGTLVGAALLLMADASFNGYLLVFGLSGLGRFLALALLARATAPDVESAEMGLRTVVVRPNAAALDAPILPSLPDEIGAFPAFAGSVAIGDATNEPGTFDSQHSAH